MIDLNEVIFCGTASWFKVYPLNGKSFTSASLLLKDNGVDIFVDIGLDPKTIESKAVKNLEEAAKSKGTIFIIGSIVERKTKDGVVPSIKASIHNTKISFRPVGINRVTISGRVTSQNTVEVSYLNPKEKTYKTRSIPISVSDKIIPIRPDDYIYLEGVLNKSGDNPLFVEVHSLTKLDVPQYGKKERLDKVRSTPEFS